MEIEPPGVENFGSGLNGIGLTNDPHHPHDFQLTLFGIQEYVSVRMSWDFGYP